jgi:hypothetical protein
MRRHPFLIYLVIEILTVISVVGIFRVIPDRQIAASFAGSLFVGAPLLMMIHQGAVNLKKNWLWYACALQFWLLFAVPILGLRVLNWDVPFYQLNILGFTGPQLHLWSSKSYMVFMIGTAWAYWKNRKN